MSTLDTIVSRQTCHAYADGPITDDELQKLLVAANAAPVGGGQFQNVALTVIRDRAFLDHVEEKAVAARPDLPNKHPLYNTSTCILVSVKKEPEPSFTSLMMSAACIVENMLLEAAELGLASTFLRGVTAMMAGDPDLCAGAKVPEGFTPAAMAAVGRPAAPLAGRAPTTEKLVLAYV